jgi:hypothetical protein
VTIIFNADFYQCKLVARQDAVAISCLPHIQRTKKVSKADTQQQPVLALTPQKSKWKFNAGVIEAYQQHCTLAQLKVEVYI